MRKKSKSQFRIFGTNSKLTKEIVKHIAKLANLRLTPKEVKKFQIQLSEILNYVDKLKKVNTKGVEPASQVTGLKNIFREDKVTPSLSQKEVLSGSKNITQGMFKIPAIF